MGKVRFGVAALPGTRHCPDCGNIDPLSRGLRLYPVVGADNDFIHSTDHWRVECDDCRYIGPAVGSPEGATGWWNIEAIWAIWLRLPVFIRTLWPEPQEPSR